MTQFTKTKSPTPRFHAGFSLLEAILVSAAIAIGVAAIYQFYQQVYASEAAHQESQNTLEITSRIMKAYSTSANFDSISNTTVINDGVIPPTMGVVTGTGDITSAFGGGVVVQPATISGESGRGFSITYTSVPRKMCTNLVSSVTRMQRYEAVYVAPAGAMPSTPTNLITSGQVGESALAAACASADKLDIMYVYQRNEVGTTNTALDPCVLPTPSTVTENLTCNPGYIGTISRTKTASCPEPYGLPVWSGWTYNDNCLVQCVVAPTSPETATSSCASGYIGTITSTRTSTCPQSTGLPVWSTWTVTSNTCALACVAPPPVDEIRSDCPSGSSGTRTWRKTATCPLPTGSYTWGAFQLYSSACTANCVLPTPSVLTQWVASSGSCDPGYTGTKTWEREQSKTATCPSGTNAPGTPTWSTFADTGATRSVSTAGCTSLCTPASPLSQWLVGSAACPSGYSGSNTWEYEQTRTSTCTPPATTPVTSTWVNSGQTRNTVNTCTPGGCTVASGTRTWFVSSNSCSNTFTAQTVASGSSLVVTDSTTPLTGSASYLCTNGTLATIASAGATCAGTCGAAPANGSRAFAGCALNQYGTWTQSTTWSSSAYPTCWTESAWSPATAPPTACTSCPGPVSETVKEWDPTLRSAPCPSGNTGVNTWEAERQHTRTNSYSCPAGTATLPAITNGAFGAWSDTGVTRNVINTCAPGSCSVTAGTVNWNVGGNACGGTVATQTVASGSSLSVSDATAPNQGSASYLCTNGTLSGTFNAGATCNVTHCTVPAASTFNWMVGGVNCSFTTSALQYIAGGAIGSFTSTNNPGTGTGNFSCSVGATALNATANVSGTTCVGSCPAKPADVTRGFAGCAINQYGSWTQTSTWTSSAYPTCWTATAYTPTVAPVGACTNCPSASTDVATEWDPTIRTQACASGYSGQITFEAQRSRSRSMTYSCPAGTATLPAPTYGSYGAWSDTGATRNVVNSCVANCTPTYQIRTWDRSPTCGAPKLYQGGTRFRQEVYQALGTCTNNVQSWPAWPASAALPTTAAGTFPSATYPGWTLVGCYDSFGSAMACTAWDYSECIPVEDPYEP